MPRRLLPALFGLSALTLLLSMHASPAAALDLEGRKYPATIQVAGKTLHLVGGGYREATFLKIDVYRGVFYAEKAGCDFKRMVTAEEVKLLRMDFVRDVGAEKQSEAMQKNFKTQLPKDASADLRTRTKTFLAVFDKDVNEGDDIEVRYVPGEGTSVRVNKKKRGPTIQGHDFMEVMWNIWFGKETCCPHLYEALTESCK
jgi:hypothetical protein